jgi:hypothetical protein
MKVFPLQQFSTMDGIFALLALSILPAHAEQSVSIEQCGDSAPTACFLAAQPTGRHGFLRYYASRQPGEQTPSELPTHILIVLHGHPRDANKTFDAAMQATKNSGHSQDTLVIAPVFQVTDPKRCHTDGVPTAQRGDLRWTCGSWLTGGLAETDQHPGSFAVLDGLIHTLAGQWPTVHTVTVAGFSAGAQMVQHYIGFAADQPGLALRYVVSDPGTWLYFDPQRPTTWESSTHSDLTVTGPAMPCPAQNRWKYGTEDLPTYLGRDANQARQHYAQADIHYLAGELDTGTGKGTFYGILDKSCAATAQGPFRLQRAQAYATYDHAKLTRDGRHPLTLIPGCAHSVSCIFPSASAQPALFGDTPDMPTQKN